jgi:hypothetical protein
MCNNPLRYVDPLGLQEAEPEGRVDMVIRPTILEFPRDTMPEDELDREEKDLLTGEGGQATGIGGAPQPQTEAEIQAGIKRIADEITEHYSNKDPKVETQPTSCPPVGTQVYRVFGGGSRGNGDFWTTANPATTINFRAAAGLYPQNTGTWIAEGTINNNSGVSYGPAEPGPTTPRGQSMVPQVVFQPGTASSQVTVNAVYNVENPL